MTSSQTSQRLRMAKATLYYAIPVGSRHKVLVRSYSAIIVAKIGIWTASTRHYLILQQEIWKGRRSMTGCARYILTTNYAKSTLVY